MRAILNIILVFSFLTATTTSYALMTQAQCPATDFSDKMGPIRNQESTHWCWANAVADQISYKMNLGPNRQVSAMDVATSAFSISDSRLDEIKREVVSTGDSSPATRYLMTQLRVVQDQRHDKDYLALPIRTGQPVLAILAYQAERGVCLESQLPTQSPPSSYGGYGFVAGTLYSKFGDRSSSFDDFTAAISTANGGTACLTPHSTLFGAGGLRTARALQTSMNQESALRVKELINSGPCKERIAMPRMEPFIVANIAKQNPLFLVKMAEVIAKYKTPLGMGFNGSILTRGRYTTTDSQHAGTLVGLRWNASSQTCEFKFRNSSGTDCGIYHSDFKGSCDAGYIWLPEADIVNSATSFFAIEPK